MMMRFCSNLDKIDTKKRLQSFGCHHKLANEFDVSDIGRSAWTWRFATALLCRNVLEQATLAVPAGDGGLLDSHMATSWHSNRYSAQARGSCSGIALVSSWVRHISRSLARVHRVQTVGCLTTVVRHCCLRLVINCCKVCKLANGCRRFGGWTA